MQMASYLFGMASWCSCGGGVKWRVHHGMHIVNQKEASDKYRYITCEHRCAVSVCAPTSSCRPAWKSRRHLRLVREAEITRGGACRRHWVENRIVDREMAGIEKRRRLRKPRLTESRRRVKGGRREAHQKPRQQSFTRALVLRATLFYRARASRKSGYRFLK